MYQLTIVYNHPADPQAFLEHYRGTHSKLAAQFPKIRSYDWHVCEMLDDSKPPHFLAATAQWDSKEDLLAALASPVGEEAVADLENFTQAGYQMQFGVVNSVVTG